MKPLQRGSLIIPPGVCERCFEIDPNNPVPAKVVHHKVHLTPTNIDDPEVSLNHDNLQRLCQDCHAYVHSMGSPRATFDRNGKPIEKKKDTLRSLVVKLTESVDEQRNIYKGE